MDWTSLIGPAVVAAVISGFVAIVGFVVSAKTAERLHRQKLLFDETQAERRTTAEIELTERKVAADLALAEKRFGLDQALATWRRRYELAEEVLAAAYEIRDALTFARGRGIFEGEGETREQPSMKVRLSGKSETVHLFRLSVYRNRPSLSPLWRRFVMLCRPILDRTSPEQSRSWPRFGT